MANFEKQDDGFKERVVFINRVAKVVKGGFLYIVTQQESRKYPVLFLLFNFIYQSIQEKQNRL